MLETSTAKLKNDGIFIYFICQLNHTNKNSMLPDSREFYRFLRFKYIFIHGTYHNGSTDTTNDIYLLSNSDSKFMSS